MNKGSYIVIAIATLSAALVQRAALSQPLQNAPADSPATTQLTSSVSTSAAVTHAHLSTTHTSYGSHLGPILTAINATPQQRQKIGDIFAQFRPAIEPVKLQYRKKRDEFLQAIVTGKSAEDIMAKQSEVNELFDRIMNEYCLMDLRVRRLLTAQQCDRYHAYKCAQGWTHH